MEPEKEQGQETIHRSKDCVIFNFGILFVGVAIWNLIRPWLAEYWSMYFFITTIATALVVGAVSTVWFLVGGIVDTRALFRDLAKRVANPLDDDRVEDGVSLSDQARFAAVEEHDCPNKR